MSKQPLHQVLQSKSVTTFTNMNSNGGKSKTVSPYSASLTYYSSSVADPFPIFQTVGLQTQMKTAGSSSVDIAETIGLIDRRLNPELYKKYQLNYALSTGSTFNEAVMWADNNS